MAQRGEFLLFTLRLGYIYQEIAAERPTVYTLKDAG